MYTVSQMLNSPGTTARSMADAGCYGCLQNTYSFANLVGFKSTTPGGDAYKYTNWPATATCYVTAYGDGRVVFNTSGIGNNNTTTVYWFYVFGSGYNGNGFEVYCADGGGSGTFGGDTVNAWITIGTYRRWYVQGGAAARTLYLYFRNSYWPQTSPGTFTLYAESVS